MSMSAEDCMRKAWACLLNGDTAGRDRWCALAGTLMTVRQRLDSGDEIFDAEPIRLPGVIALPDRSGEAP